MKLFGCTPEQLGTIHFIGINGIGMSGIAQVLAENGFTVQGSDTSHGYTEEALWDAGAEVFIGHDAAHVPSFGLVVLSSAIKADNPERMEAEKRGLKIVHRADILAEIMKNYKTVAISGTHGKTSTTALIYTAMKAAGLPVGVINGGVLNAEGSNAVTPPQNQRGEESWLVVEADESDASFLKLNPTVAVVTNVEAEHMDTYGTEEKLLASFEQFINSADEAVLCVSDPNTLLLSSRAETDVITYGFEDDADVYVKEYAPQGRGMEFDAVLRGGVLEDVVVNLPGAHYVLNSLAALAVVQLLKGNLEEACKGLETFEGVGRRFSYLGTIGLADSIDDYGHHPTEIAATLDAAKTVYGNHKVVAVVQPHRYTRLRDLMDEFATCTKVADATILLPVYPAGESPIEGVSSEVLASRMEDAIVAQDESELAEALRAQNLQKGDAIVFLGAGSISKMAHNLTTRE